MSVLKLILPEDIINNININVLFKNIFEIVYKYL